MTNEEIRKHLDAVEARLESAVAHINEQSVTIAAQAALLADCRRWMTGPGMSASELEMLLDSMERLNVPKGPGE